MISRKSTPDSEADADETILVGHNMNRPSLSNAERDYRDI